MAPLGGKREIGLVEVLWLGGSGSGRELEADEGVDGLEVERCLAL
jgi:hypothetical protein